MTALYVMSILVAVCIIIFLICNETCAEDELND